MLFKLLAVLQVLFIQGILVQMVGTQIKVMTIHQDSVPMHADTNNF